MKTISPEIFTGVWSATPTPLKKNLTVDTGSIGRLVKHHLRLGVRGLFVGGTCGEGAWLTDGERRLLTQAMVKAAKGKLPIAVQVTDNSAPRILDRIKIAEEDGADAVVIAPPQFLLNVTPQNLLALYQQAIRGSTLPVLLYHFGEKGNVPLPLGVLKSLMMEENVVAMKDSSSDERYRDAALAARKKRPEMRLLNGDEFNCAAYAQAGYDGLMLGGAAFQGFLANQIWEAAKAGDMKTANALQARMNKMMFAVYGGKQIKCWLAGEKYLLTQLGVFRGWSNILDYELTDSCRNAIERLVEDDRDVLLP